MDFGRVWTARADAPCSHVAAPKAGGGSPSAPDTAIKLSLHPARRLRQRSEYRKVYEQGVRRHSPHFVVFALSQAPVPHPNEQRSSGTPVPGSAKGPEPPAESRPSPETPSRFGITVSRKLGQATVRNRIRRRTREVLRRHLQELGNGWDIVINPRRTVLEAEFAVLEEELIGQLRRLSAPAAPRRS